MMTPLQLGTEWDVQALLVFAGIVLIVFGIVGQILVGKFVPLPPWQRAVIGAFGVGLFVVGLVGPFREEEDGLPPVTPTTAPEETSTPVSATSPPTLIPTSSPVPSTPTPTPTPCPLVSGRLPIDDARADLAVTISRPGHCQQDLPSEEKITVRGAYSDDLAGLEIWLLVYSADGEYYPQSSDACRQLPARASGGQWATEAYLGRSGWPEQFDLVAAVADVDSEASREFKAWLQRGCDAGDFPGFLELPGGLAEMDAITVHTTG